MNNETQPTKEKTWQDLCDYYFAHSPLCTYKDSGECICQRKDIIELIVKIRSLAQQEILDRAMYKIILKKRIEKRAHTPNCMRGTCKNDHHFCSMSLEDEAYNEGLDEALDVLSTLKDTNI